MSQGDSGSCIARGRIDGATGNRLAGMGFVSARTGAGVYTITLDQPVDATQSIVLVTVEGAGARCATMSAETDSVKTISIFTTVPAAQDNTFSFAIYQTNV